MRIIAAGLPALLALLSACTDAPHPPCEDASCLPTDPGPSDGQAPTTTPPGQPIVNTSISTILFEDCDGIALGIEVPADTVVDDVPADFGPASSIPFSAYLGMTGYDCPRIVALNQTFEDVALLWTYASVLPDNDSWGTNGLSAYTFDVLVTNQAVGDHLRAAGVAATLGTLSRQSTPAGDLSQDTWEFSHDDTVFRLTFHRDAEDNGSVYDRVWYHWFGSGPYQRVDIHHRDANSKTFHTDAGRIELEGASGFHEAASVDQSAAYGASIRSLNWEMEATSKSFGS